ncbi:MAG: ABC transporter permease [Clostridiales bacterium]|nr:ABC transporter permease [Clostridiales bacterium]
MIKVSVKRVIAFIPYAAAYFIVLGLTAFAIAFWSQNVLFKDGSFSAVKVACYLPDDSSLNDTGFSLVSHMNSIESSVSLIKYDSEDEVREAVDDEEAVAGLIIPEGFASGIFTGENLQIEVVFKSADTFDEHVVKDVMLVLANDLGVGQASVQTVYSLCDEYDIDADQTSEIVSVAQANELGYAIDRMSIFDINTLDDISVFTLTQKITAAALIYILLLSVFVFSYFCKGSNDAFIARAKLSGISPVRFFITETCCVASMMYVIYVLFFAALNLADIDINVRSLLLIIPVITIISLIVTGVCYCFKTPVASAYISFSVFTVLMYLAGGLLPLEFLPLFLQKGAVYNPLRLLIDLTMEVMFS